jgi:hypothetical protein
MFLELAIDLGRMPTARDLAKRYVEIYERPESVFAGHADLVREQFAHFEGACRGYLGQTSAQFPDLTPELLLARSLGLNFPILSGLFSLTVAGLLFPGRPVEAYRAAFELAFFDIGYAREATALLAATVGAAAGGEDDADSLFERIVTLDPLHLGGPFSAPYVIDHLPQRRATIAHTRTDQEAARALSLVFRHDHPFDPLRTLGIAWLSVLAAEGDPLRAILIAVNHVGIDDDGKPTRYEDIDCYGAVAGAIAGAIAGDEAFPAEMLEQVVESNKAAYGIDIEATIAGFCERFLG